MLSTPFGNIEIYFDNQIQKNIKIVKGEKNNSLYPDVKSIYLLGYLYHTDKKAHRLKCILNTKQKGIAESGEHFDAVSFYIQNGKITIGCKSDFGMPKEGGFDYDDTCIDNGIEIFIHSFTKEQYFIFAVSWLIVCTEKNEVQTYFASDPSIHE